MQKFVAKAVVQCHIVVVAKQKYCRFPGTGTALKLESPAPQQCF